MILKNVGNLCILGARLFIPVDMEVVRTPEFNYVERDPILLALCCFF